LPYLKKGVRKDFVLHTKNVVKAIEEILKEEKGNSNLLYPAAILHDTGWSDVPKRLQLTNINAEKKKALKLHIKYALPIARKILKKMNYKSDNVNKIVLIIKSHKFSNPKDLNKRILIDADALSDAYKNSFYSDAKNYSVSPIDLYKYRLANNNFYTKIAKKIFQREINKRRKELFG